MPSKRALLVAIVLSSTAALARMQQPIDPRPGFDKSEHFSPLDFDALRAYQQAFPADTGTPAVLQASAARYWAYRGVAYRGSSPMGGVWTTLGPLSSLQDPTQATSRSISGRVSALAISPSCEVSGACRLWVGTAGGGVWRSDDAMNTANVGWRWIGEGLGTNNIGSLSLDPNDASGNTIFVGTGETNTPQNSGAGTGVYRSTDGGDHWTRLSTSIVDPVVSASPIDFTLTRSVSSVVVVPSHPDTIYVATTTAMLGMTAVRGGQSQTTGYPQPRVGLYKTENGGATWTLAWSPPLEAVAPANPNLGVGASDTMSGVRLVKLDPKDSSIVYASAWNNAIHRSAASLEGGDAAFKPVFAIVGLQRFQDLAMFDLTINNGHTRMYVYNGTLATATQGFYRLDNADVASATLVSGAGANVANTGAWLGLTSQNTAEPGATSRSLCSSQCFYDLVVAAQPGHPDAVVVGGVGTPTFGENTLRSANAGASFYSLSRDAQPSQNFTHSDVRAVVFHPKDPNIIFVGSDGGVTRTNGGFSDITSGCSANVTQFECRSLFSAIPTRLYFLNVGLQTLQFYNVSVDPQAPLTRLLGGLQDNGTIWTDGTNGPRIWKPLFPSGDGTSASGFHPTRSNVTFASFQSNHFFTNFANGDVTRWVRTDAPIVAANERATVTASTGRQFLTFDLVNPDTQFTGFQHIWRTVDNGGSQAQLEASCLTGSSSACGDWVPLGVTFPFQTGSTADSATRKPGDLTSDGYGADRAGGIIVAAERTPADAGTLWAATNLGRLFVAKNADAAAASVTFVRIDSSVIPTRFLTRIVVDRTDPNVAYLSYSGFNALTPSTPGHIFRAVYNAASHIATFTSLDQDLGDLPINTIAYDDLRGDLYAGTDFGPLVLRNGSPKWDVAGVGFPEVLMVDLKYLPAQRLLIAATHGLGIFYMNLTGAPASPAARR